MKKVFFLLLIFASCFRATAQNIVVESALTNLKTDNLEAAKEDIDRAMNYPATKDQPKALYAKARIYMQIQGESAKFPQYKDKSLYREAAQALMRVAELKPEFEKADIDDRLRSCAIMYYNDAVKAINAKKDTQSVEYMTNVIKIHDLNGGKRYAKYTEAQFPVKWFDTLAAKANVTVALTYTYAENFEKAIPCLNAALENPITRTAANYNLLADVYIKQKKDKEMFDVVEAGLKYYPTDKRMRQNELYYYSKTGRTDELVKKLEEGVAANPNDAEMQFNLGIVYLDKLESKEIKADTMKRKELIVKTDNALSKAVSLMPDNVTYNYNYGVLFYNQGNFTFEKMNSLAETINSKGEKNSKNEQKQYDELKIVRDGFFNKSITYFEKVYGILEPKSASLQGDDLSTYKNCLQAMQAAYTLTGKDEKYKEIKEKMDAVNK